MAQPTILQTKPRAASGSAQARRERREGRVPVNVYGHGEGNQHLLMDEHELSLALHTATQVFTLSIGGAEQPCLVKAVQYDTFGQQILHVDFTRVSMTEEVEVEVTLEFTGTPKGVAAGGQLVVLHPALWVRCMANAIPDSIGVDIAAIELGHGTQNGLSLATTGQARQAASINSPATDLRENADNRQMASTGGSRGDKRSD
jgi:large subunit ribosomal protein L25